MTDLSLGMDSPRVIVPGWLSYEGPETLDVVRDLDGTKLDMVSYEPSHQRNRIIDSSNIDLPKIEIESAHRIAVEMEKTGAPAVFGPVLAKEETVETTDRPSVCAYGFSGMPGQEKSSLLAYLAYLSNSNVISLDQFYPGFSAEEYIKWLKEDKVKSWTEAKQIIFEHLPKWLQQKKLGEAVKDAPTPSVKPLAEVLKIGFDRFKNTRNESGLVFIDLPGLPRNIEAYKTNRLYNPYDLAASGLEICDEAPILITDGWINNKLQYLAGKGLELARYKREVLINKLRMLI